MRASELTLAAPEALGFAADRLARIGTWMQGYVDAGRLPGAIVLIARHGQVAYLDSCGHRDVAARAPLTLDTIHRIYSMTKPVTSVAAMMLYEEGHFQLDDPVSRWIPGFERMRVHVGGAGENMVTEAARGPVTIHHLLTHTSGLTYGFAGETPVAALYREGRTDFGPRSGALADVVARLAAIPLLHHPGAAWRYGVSTDVLGHLVEVVSGEPLDRFFRERIFAPLGMNDTGFAVPSAEASRLAALYEHHEGGMRLLETGADSVYVGSVSTLSGGGGLLSTAADYFRFTELLRGRGAVDGTRLLGRKTLEYMTSNHLPGDLAAMGQEMFNETTLRGIGFGLGFSVMLDPVKACVMGSPGEFAWGGMASTAFWVDPLEDLSVILLTQLCPSSTYPLRRELRVLTYQALVA